MTNRIPLTDPAYEAGELMKWLQSIAEAQTQTGEVIASNLGVKAYRLEHTELMLAVKVRLARLADLAADAQDARLTDETRKSIVDAAQRLSQIFDAPRLAAPWTNTRKGYIREADLFAIVLFSPIAKDIRPLRVITDDTRDQILQGVERAIADLKSTQTVDPWLANELLQGLRRLELITKHLTFFGHEVAISEIQSLVAKVEVVKTARPGVLTSFRLAISVLLTAASAYALPHELAEATRDYASLYVHHVRPALIEFEERLLLTAPAERGGDDD